MNKKDNKVTIKLTGLGFKNDENITNLSIINKKYEIDNSFDFAKFIRNSLFYEVERRDKTISVPKEAQKTWNVKRIENGSKELFLKWSKEFENNKHNRKQLTQLQILTYWLQYTGCSYIREAIIELES